MTEVPKTAITASVNYREALERFSIYLIRRAVLEHDGNVTAAARALGLSRYTLYRKLKAAKQREDQDELP